MKFHCTPFMCFLLLVVTFPFINSSLQAQTQKDNSKIEMINHLYTYDTDEPQPLEKHNALFSNKIKGLGYGGADMFLVVEGETSSVKLSSNQAKTFVVNTGGQALKDYAIYKLALNKKKRQAFIGKSTMTGVKNADFAAVISMSKVADGIFKMTLDKVLEKGEYFFVEKSTTPVNTLNVFAFTIE